MTIRFFGSLFACGLLTLFSGWLLFSTPTDRAVEEATLHQTLTPGTTQVPLPERPETLSDIQALLRVSDEACQLPCFWGIRPGYTTEEETIEFLQPVPVGNNAPELQYVYREEPQQDPIFSLGIGVRDNLVSLIEIIVRNPSSWLPPQTLELPQLLSTIPSVPYAYSSINITTQRLFLTFAYDEGVLVQYSFVLHIEGVSLIESDIQFCPLLEENDFIKLRLRNNDADFLLEEYGIPQMVIRNKIWPVERITGMEIEDFVAQIIANPDECINLLSYSELLEMGYDF